MSDDLHINADEPETGPSNGSNRIPSSVWMFGVPTLVVLIVLTVIVMLRRPVLDVGGDDQVKIYAVRTPAMTTVLDGSNPERGPAIVCADPEVYEELWGAAAKTGGGELDAWRNKVAALERGGKAFAVSGRPRVTVIQENGSWVNVVILEGEHEGKSALVGGGWVASDD